MKRFYCTICGRVKRVRKYPPNVSRESIKSDVVSLRVGTCSKHGEMAQGKSERMRRYAEAHDIEVVELNMLRRKTGSK